MNITNIDIDEFMDKFNKEYKFLYENSDRVAGYREALDYGDAFIDAHPDFVAEFVRYRGDFISSDREVAAFAFALDDMDVDL